MSVREAFRQQGEACAALGSPFMKRLMPLVGDRLKDGRVADKILNWPGDPFPNADSVPLRLAGALHAVRLEDMALQDVYPPNDVSDDKLWAAIEDVLHQHAQRFLAWLENAPQTNEVRRSAPLLGALSLVQERYDRPIELLELGCSAGLNLCADRYCVDTGRSIIGDRRSSVQLKTEWRGNVPDNKNFQIVARQGVDLAPIDPTTTDGRLRLLSYLWADQNDRIKATNAAIDISRSISTKISAGDAGDWLESILSTPSPERIRFLFHTVAWQYFPETTKARALNALETTRSPLVRFSMEADGGKGAKLTLTHYPSGEIQELGRADFHGRWVDWYA